MRLRLGARYGQQGPQRSLFFVARLGQSAVLSAAVLAVLAGVSGCGQKPVATLNGTQLTEQEFAKLCETATEIQPNLGSVGQQVLMRWVQTTLQRDQAKQQNLYPTQKDVDARLEGIRNQLQFGGTSLEKQLQAQGISQATYKERLTDQMVQEALLFAGVPITDAELESAFNKDKAKFTKPTTIRIAQITLKSKAALDNAVNTLNQSSGSFEQLARSVSQDPFASQGGMVPYDLPESIQAGGPVQPAVVKAAYKLKDGEISKPLQVGATWVIAKLVKRTEGQTPTLSQVREIVRNTVIQQKMQSPAIRTRMEENQKKLFSALGTVDFVVNRTEYRGLQEMVKNGGRAPGAGAPPAEGGPMAPPTGGPGSVPAGEGGPGMPPPPPSGG